MTDTPHHDDQPELAPINIGALTEYLEAHPDIHFVVVTETTEEWFG